MVAIDEVTKRWIRDKSDERAAARGMRFNEEWANHFEGFCADNLKLYEGQQFAGKPLILTNWQLELKRLFGWQWFNPEVGRWVRRFRKAIIFIAKKNKKSPTLAALGLYLLAADGEMGNKVFFAAKDGAQAKENVGKHALEMLYTSPRLDRACDVNLTTLQITHRKSKSILRPISNSNKRTQQSKEGINGSVLVDEIHVVDAEFMGRVSRSGISREEPLQIEVSTAGEDPQSYGFKRFEYAQGVVDGTIDDDHTFALVYAAPQDLSDEDLAQDPVRYGKMANPAWGETVREHEFLTDYNESKVSPVELARFKMYRCNIWQKAASPWLRPADWARGARDWKLEDFHGQRCWIGMDLAKTQDTSALVAIFRAPTGEPFLFPKFFLPEETARRLADKVEYLTWAKQERITLTPGNVIQWSVIRLALLEWMKLFAVQALVYDATYAAQICQRLVEEDEVDPGIPQPFKQDGLNYAKPVNDFERRVLEGSLLHSNNPVLNWQAGNAKVRFDAKGNKTIVKQTNAGDIRTIDGVVASVMGLAGFENGDGAAEMLNTVLFG